MKHRFLQSSGKINKQNLIESQNISDQQIDTLKLSNHIISNNQNHIPLSNNYLNQNINNNGYVNGSPGSNRQSKQFTNQSKSRMLENSRKKVSLRKGSQLFQSSIRSNSSSKISKRNQIIQFDNIKWISIISAYDPSRLKNISLSKQSCQKFLQKQGQNLKKDSRSLLYFNDLIKNYKSWLNKIHLQYSYIIQKFLYSKRSVNLTLNDLKPKLDQVIFQTQRMRQNVDECLKNYQNHQFRQLLKKFQIQLQNSMKIQQIMEIVDQSKNRINNYFKKFDNQKKIQNKINKLKNQGINQVKKIVNQSSYNNNHHLSFQQAAIEQKIINRFQLAINEMAQKSGQAYKKIRIVKQLLQKFKNTSYQSNNPNKLDLKSINIMCKICRQICFQAEAFQKFSQNFINQGQILNDDLKILIKRYEQQINQQKKKAIQLQFKFLNIIFTQIIKKLKNNIKISSVYQNNQQNNQQYRLILIMIQDVADCLSDQNKKVILQKLIKQTRTIFQRLHQQLKFIKQNKKFQQIDTQQGLISILQISKLIKQYKQKITILRKKFENTSKQLVLPLTAYQKIQYVGQDNQIQFINQVINLSKKINNSNLKQKIEQAHCFKQINFSQRECQNISLFKINQQIIEQKIVKQLTDVSNQFHLLQSRNILQKNFGSLSLQQLIFKESLILTEIKQTAQRTKQTNIIIQLQQVIKKYLNWIQKQNKISDKMKYYFQRILIRVFVKGLKNQDVKQIDNPDKFLAFPNKQTDIQTLKSKAKYRKLLKETIKSSKPSIQPKQIQQNFILQNFLQNSVQTIQNYIKSFYKIIEIKKNQNNQFYISKQSIFHFSQKLFKQIFIKETQKQSKTYIKKNEQIQSYVNQILTQCKQKIISLTRKALQQEYAWKDNNNKTNTPIYIQKIISLFQYYKQKNKKLQQNLSQSLNIFINEKIQNVRNKKQQIKQFKQFQLYGQILLNLVNYCKQTEQNIHVILDNEKCPLIIVDPNQKNILKQIFKGIKKGKEIGKKQIEKIVFKPSKIAIQLQFIKNQKQQKNSKSINQIKDQQSNKKINKKNNKQKDSQQYLSQQEMTEQINDQFQSQIPSQSMNEQFQEQFDEVQDQQPIEQMQQNYEVQQQQIVQDQISIQEESYKQIVQEQNQLQQLLDESQTIGKNKGKNKGKDKRQSSQVIKSKKQIKDQFQEFDQVQIKPIKLENKDKDKKLQQVNNKLKENQQKEKLLKQEQKKIQLKKKQAQKAKIILKQSIYEILSFISSLSDLKLIINYILTLSSSFFKEYLNWTFISQYLNNHIQSSNEINLNTQLEKSNAYIKSIQQLIDQKIKKDFQIRNKIFYNEIKSLEEIKQMKKQILFIQNSNQIEIIKLLTKYRIQYNLLKNQQNKVLYILINQSKQQRKQGSIHGYLAKIFKFYNDKQFNIKKFIENALKKQEIIFEKQEQQKSIQYTFKDNKYIITPKKSIQLEKLYEKITKITFNYSKTLTKDPFNKYQLCINLWKKALKIFQEQNKLNHIFIQQFQQLDQNMKKLQIITTDSTNILHYNEEIHKKSKQSYQKIKSLKSKLENVIFKCNLNNILQCIKEIDQFYDQEIIKKIQVENKKIVLFFDKQQIKQNLEKINKILSNQQGIKNNDQFLEKILIEIIFDKEKLAQLNQSIQITENNKSNCIFILQNKFLQRSQIIGKTLQTNHQIIMKIVTLLKIQNHFILTQNPQKTNKIIFILKKTKQSCIQSYLTFILTSLQTKIEQNKNISFKNNKFFQVLSKNNNNNITQLFINQQINKIFKIKNQKFKNQIIINHEIFNLNKSLEIILKTQQIKQKINLNVQKLKNDLINKKINPSVYIFEKYFNSNQKNIDKLKTPWNQYKDKFQQNYQLIDKIIKNQNNCLFYIKAIKQGIQNQLNKYLRKLNHNINSLIQIPKKQAQFTQIYSQISNCYKWISKICPSSDKNKYLLVSYKDDNHQLLYFQVNVLKFDYNELSMLFSTFNQFNSDFKSFIFQNLVQNKNKNQVKSFKIQNHDILIQINALEFSNKIQKFLQQISSQEHYKARSKDIIEFVQKFNRLYFISNTTKQINFKEQLKKLNKLHNKFKQSLNKLSKAYQLRFFLQSFSNPNKPLFSKNLFVNKCKEIIINKLQKNEKIMEDDIPKVLAKLQKIKISENISSIDSYSEFHSWFYQTVMNVLQMPFYNIITHGVKDKNTLQNYHNFIGVVLTQNPVIPGLQDNQLQKYLSQLFLYTNHLPIYQKSDDLTVQLKKQPVYFSFQNQNQQIKIGDVIKYLKQQNYEIKNKDEQKQKLYLRIDQIMKENMNQLQKQVQNIGIISLQKFINDYQSQVNIQINSNNLNVQLQFNIIQEKQGGDYKNALNLTATHQDTFENVYIGKRISLKNLSKWLYNKYDQLKNVQYIQENKQLKIQELYDQFIQKYDKTNKSQKYIQWISQIIKKLSPKQIKDTKNSQVINLRFQSSKIRLTQILSMIKEIKKQQYQKEKNLQKHLNTYFTTYLIKFEENLYKLLHQHQTDQINKLQNHLFETSQIKNIQINKKIEQIKIKNNQIKLDRQRRKKQHKQKIQQQLKAQAQRKYKQALAQAQLKAAQNQNQKPVNGQFQGQRQGQIQNQVQIQTPQPPKISESKLNQKLNKFKQQLKLEQQKQNSQIRNKLTKIKAQNFYSYIFKKLIYQKTLSQNLQYYNNIQNQIFKNFLLCPLASKIKNYLKRNKINIKQKYQTFSSVLKQCSYEDFHLILLIKLFQLYQKTNQIKQENEKSIKRESLMLLLTFQKNQQLK